MTTVWSKSFIQSKEGSKYGKYFQKYIHYTVASRARYDTTDGEYEDEYSCSPPKLCMAIFSIIELITFIYDWVYYDGAPRYGSLGEILIYDPSRRKEAWRYVTYMFVHMGTAHLVVNLSVQILLGVPLEMVHGNWRVFCIYISGVLAGSLGTSISDPTVFLAGASGGVYALMTAHISTIIMIGYVAHFAGAVTGLLVGINVLRNLRVKRWENYVWWASLVLFSCLMLSAITINVAFPSYFPPQKQITMIALHSTRMEKYTQSVSKSFEFVILLFLGIPNVFSCSNLNFTQGCQISEGQNEDDDSFIQRNVCDMDKAVIELSSPHHHTGVPFHPSMGIPYGTCAKVLHQRMAYNNKESMYHPQYGSHCLNPNDHGSYSSVAPHNLVPQPYFVVYPTNGCPYPSSVQHYYQQVPSIHAGSVPTGQLIEVDSSVPSLHHKHYSIDKSRKRNSSEPLKHERSSGHHHYQAHEDEVDYRNSRELVRNWLHYDELEVERNELARKLCEEMKHQAPMTETPTSSSPSILQDSFAKGTTTTTKKKEKKPALKMPVLSALSARPVSLKPSPSNNVGTGGGGTGGDSSSNHNKINSSNSSRTNKGRSTSYNGSSDNFWECLSCTFHNKPSVDICEMCDKSRIQGNEVIPLASGGRECDFCTLTKSWAGAGRLPFTIQPRSDHSGQNQSATGSGGCWRLSMRDRRDRDFHRFCNLISDCSVGGYLLSGYPSLGLPTVRNL
ncbi:unnamed protein product [Nesidiocoris tenuis]|uniref:RanBP2-type domain-containing protein n=1 Tax=Nesidiocoris tenuis TaxID=355587 RepID=A0A6H5GXL4_9HEMI|nr:unnamed protein product [Nesidiocoris tenuis]